MYQLDYERKAVRSSAILTTSYVAGTVLDQLNRLNQLIVLVNFTKGSLTTAELKIEFATTRKFTLAYDGQSANFTVGKKVRNVNNTASGIITADSDGGTSGTLTLQNVQGTFVDNEDIIEDIVNGVGGRAKVNGTLTDATDWYQETASSVTAGTDTNTAVEHVLSATGKYRIAIPLKDEFVRISVKGTGTVTSSLMAVEAVVGIV